jgi:predicted nucleic acid-binding protein
VIAVLDTSVLTRRYVPEQGSRSVHALLRSGRELAVSRLTFAELCAAVARAHRNGVIDIIQRDAILMRLPGDFESMSVIELRKPIVERVGELVKKYPLRGFDALQLAACLKLRAEQSTELWAADGELIAAARAEGIKVMAL